jgi:fructose-bisphosphate aldolase class I
MNKLALNSTVQQLLQSGKGILAADESTDSIAKRFAKVGVENVEEMRESYRELLFTTPGISDNITGVILFDETLREAAHDGRPLRSVLRSQNILVGCKVDKGLTPLKKGSIEMQTKGLEGLADRLSDYFELGTSFTKWRAVFTIGKDTPSNLCIKKNAEILATYASITQEVGMVPIVEPEVLASGKHTAEECYEATEKVLKGVFKEMYNRGVDLRFVLLKPNMIIPGLESKEKMDSVKVGNMTVSCLKETVPPEVPGIVFLSGGQSEIEACENLNEIVQHNNLPWKITFSYSRALQNPALDAWAGRSANLREAQKIFAKRAKLASLAQTGKYSRKLED